MAYNIYEKFEQITKVDIKMFLEQYLIFSDRGVPSMLRFYNGMLSEPPVVVFKVYETLVQKAKEISEIISIHSESFNTVDYWDLLEQLESVELALDTLSVLAKYYRSTVIHSSYANNVNSVIRAKEGATFEMESFRLGYQDKEERAVDIAYTNRIAEIDYESGDALVYKYKDVSQTITSSGIISKSKESYYGNDIAKKLSFQDNDLLVLNSDNTLNQTVDILFNLTRGDSPEFSEQGMPSDILSNAQNLGHTLNIAVRNWRNLFLQDDVFESVIFEEPDLDQDNASVDLSIITKQGLTIKRSLYAS